MKGIQYAILLCMIGLMPGISTQAQDELQPYYQIGTLEVTMDKATVQIKEALLAMGFEVLGEYNPGGNKNLKSIAYTRTDLQSLTLMVEDRGIMASILKIGLRIQESEIVVSMLNPDYLFYAYLRDDADSYMNELKSITRDAKSAMKKIGSEFSEFGGSEEIDNLKKYHYMAFMPYFDDPEELRTFSSFEEGVATIRKNLEAKKGNTLKVYEMVLDNEKVAVFGVGLMDKEDGESSFLPVIGEDNIAAMPYEIVLMDKKASMLHGKYRIALHWPELSMGQFMKISSTPGDIEDFLEAITED